MGNIEYLIAAFGIALLGLAGYTLHVRRQRDALARQLAADVEPVTSGED